VAKQTGIGGRLWAGSADISGDTGAISSIAESRAQIDVTGIDKSFMERLPGLGDGTIEFSGYFNASGAHPQFSAMGTANVIVTASFGTAAGDSAASLSGANASYGVQRGADGSLATSNSFTSRSGYGVEWGLLLAGGVSASGTGTSVDWGAATSTGGAAYLHVTSVTAGTVTVKVQSSTDNSSWGDVAGLTFTATSAGTAERVGTTASNTTINRYTRYSVSGGTAVIAVNLHRG
jgi:hypothetical protein